MAIKPVYLVAGFGRCGLTATMQMLWYGGAPVAGTYPAFEDQRFGVANPDPVWISQQHGKVVKYVDPSVNRLPAAITAKTVWLDRAPDEQAKSMLKLVSDSGLPAPRAAIKAMAGSLRKQRAGTVEALRRHGPVMQVTFQDLVSQPYETASRIIRFFGATVFPDPVIGSQIILRRSPTCAPDMEIEMRAMAAAQSLRGRSGAAL